MKGALRAVLIVEDDAAIAECLRDLLETETGVVVSVAHTFAEADTAMGQVAFDELLLDAKVHGPVEQTVAFLQRVKNHGFAGRVTAISAQPHNNAVLCQHGADAGVVKTNVRGIMGSVLSPA